MTPLAAVTVAVNTTTARLGESTTGVGISGAYSSKADHKASATTTATGQTEGSSVAVGALAHSDAIQPYIQSNEPRCLAAATLAELSPQTVFF